MMENIQRFPKKLPQEKVGEILKTAGTAPFLFLETSRPDAVNYRSFLFSSFSEIITFTRGDSLDAFFKSIQRYLRQGYWLCGFFSYEFGYFLEPKLTLLAPPEAAYPFAWLGVCKKPVVWDHRRLSFPEPEIPAPPCVTIPFVPGITPAEYREAIGRIKDYLERGETYQVNFTFKLKSEPFAGDPRQLYLLLRKSQPTAYSAYVHTDRHDFLSFSPELFFRMDDGHIDTRPMKGTIERGRFLQEDIQRRFEFAGDEKIRAENVMIVDLLRNDLGRIAGAKEVSVDELFTIERYPTLYQMISSISARLGRRCDVRSLLEALFPSGSVTGAPKVRTMEIIRQLERGARGIYTGSIGYISPDGRACFNVSIRTLEVDTVKKTCEIGVGGGIVYDSIDRQELEEAMLKAHFFLKPQQSFSLIETIRWERNGYVRLNLHLDRLESSCEYFSLPYDRAELATRLENTARVFSADNVYKVRLLYEATGEINIAYDILGETSEPVRVLISSHVIDPADRFLYHKTTLRQVYESEQKSARRRGFFEAVFFNRAGELTEGTMTNVFLKKHGQLLTSPVKCGLLGGVLRKELLRQGVAREEILTREDLLTADMVYVGNSVRGLLPAQVDQAPVWCAEKNV